MAEVEMRQQEFAALYEEIFGGGHHKSSDDEIFEPAHMSSELKERLEDALEADPALKADYSNPAEVGARSDREFHLCARFYAAGFDEGEIYAVMGAPAHKKSGAHVAMTTGFRQSGERLNQKSRLTSCQLTMRKMS